MPAVPPVRKSLGQHFLSDTRILGRIVDALELSGTETVVEIGPGRGSLTALLVERAGRVVAIELDRALAALLGERFAEKPSLSVMQADVLDVDLAAAAGGPFRLVGNVPYYITTPILFHALEPPCAELSVFLVQREVAERIVAPAGSEAYGALSVNVQALAKPEVLFHVSPGSFRPPPKVDSSVIRLRPLAEPLVSADQVRGFSEFVIGAFGMRRKQMRRVLRSLWALPADAVERALAEQGIAPDARPETLSPPQFVKLHLSRPTQSPSSG